MALIVRRARVADAPVVAAIYVESWNRGFAGLMRSRSLTRELVSRWRLTLAATGPQRWWVGEMEDAVVGFAGIGPSRDPVDVRLGELDTIAVLSTRWRLGVGRALMSVAVARLATDGYREAILWTLDGYERGRRFYESTGWRLDGATRDEGRQVRYRRTLRVISPR